MKSILFTILSIFLFSTLHAQTVTVGSSNADYITNGINDEVEIQAAINLLANGSGGLILLHAQTFHLSSKIIPKSNVHLIGMGIDQTILKSNHTFDYVIFNNQTPIEYFSLKALTIDPSNTQNASGVRLNYATNCSIESVKFTNVTCNGWHLIFGIHGDQPEILQADFSSNNLVDNCVFDGHQGSLEMLLLFNTKNTIVRNSIFKNKTRGCPTDGNAPVLGLWQRTDSILIENCQFLNNESSEAIYYSSSSFNTIIKDCQFKNTGSIRGSNDSDWEAINELYDYAENLKIDNCDFVGGENDRTKMAIQLGAIKNVLVKNCTIEAYEEGITFQGGFTLEGNGHKAPKNWAVINTTIKNCNPNNDVHGLHGGCLFTEGTHLNGFFICGRIYDDQATPTMRYPLIFEYLDPAIYPTQTYDSIFILGTELSPIAPYNQIQFNHQVVRGENLIFEDCAANPAPNFCNVCDTPQSMTTYVDMMKPYDATTAQKILDLDALSISLNTSACLSDTDLLTIDNQVVSGDYAAISIITVNTVTTTTQATFKAKNSITLSSGFHTQAGSEFLAIIEDCSNVLTQKESAVQKKYLSQVSNLRPYQLKEVPAIKVFPNPFKDQLTIDYFIPANSKTSIYLTDILGKREWISPSKMRAKGNHQLVIDMDDLSAGTYFIVLKNEDTITARQVVRL